MNHDKDYDRDNDKEDVLDNQALKHTLQESLDYENKMMKQYLMTAEKIHNNETLKKRLQNFSEGNAKRSQQLSDELKNI